MAVGSPEPETSLRTPPSSTNKPPRPRPRPQRDSHIRSGSSVVDQGTSTNAPGDDIDGDARPEEAGIDMGSDEKEAVNARIE